jgi:hypothetical protein
VGELGPQDTGSVGLDLGDKLSGCPTRVRFEKQVNVVRHHLKRVDSHVTHFGRFVDQFLQSSFDSVDQHLAPIFWAPDDVILEAENCPGIARISGVTTIHAALYKCGTPNTTRKGVPSAVSFRRQSSARKSDGDLESGQSDSEARGRYIRLVLDILVRLGAQPHFALVEAGDHVLAARACATRR